MHLIEAEWPCVPFYQDIPTARSPGFQFDWTGNQEIFITTLCAMINLLYFSTRPNLTTESLAKILQSISSRAVALPVRLLNKNH